MLSGRLAPLLRCRGTCSRSGAGPGALYPAPAPRSPACEARLLRAAGGGSVQGAGAGAGAGSGRAVRHQLPAPHVEFRPSSAL